MLEVYDAATGDAFEVGRVRVWEPADRLVFGWRQGNYEPDQFTEVEVRFEPSDRGTRVILEHRGLDALPDDAGARHGLGRSAAYVTLVRDWLQGQLDEYRLRAEARSA